MIFYNCLALLSWNDNFVITYLLSLICYFFTQSYSFIFYETLVISHWNNCAKRSNFQGWMTNITRRVSNLFWLITYWIDDEINVWLVNCYFFKWKGMQEVTCYFKYFAVFSDKGLNPTECSRTCRAVLYAAVSLERF